ncbi:TPA: hypothetical protein ACJXXT_000208 [Pseudomonas aeruginosa]
MKINKVYEANKELIKCFELVESDLIDAIKLAVNNKFAIVIKESFLKRLRALDSTIQHEHIYTFKSRMKEIFEPNHAVYGAVPAYIMKGIEKARLEIKGDDQLITTLSFREINDFIKSGNDDEYEMSYIQQTMLKGVVNGDTYGKEVECARLVFEKTENHIQTNNLNVTAYEIYKHYISVAKSSTVKATSIGKSYVKNGYEKNLNIAVNTIINATEKECDFSFDFHYDFENPSLFGILNQIAELDGRQLHLFTTSHYTRIPFFEELESIDTMINTHTNDANYIYLKGKKGITEVSFPFSRSSLGYFEIKHHPYNESSLTLLGYEFEVTTDFFSGSSLELFEIVFYDNNQIDIFKDLKFDHEELRKIALEGDSTDTKKAILDYLQDRAMLYRRRDNRRTD